MYTRSLVNKIEIDILLLFVLIYIHFFNVFFISFISNKNEMMVVYHFPTVYYYLGFACLRFFIVSIFLLSGKGDLLYYLFFWRSSLLLITAVLYLKTTWKVSGNSISFSRFNFIKDLLIYLIGFIVIKCPKKSSIPLPLLLDPLYFDKLRTFFFSLVGISNHGFGLYTLNLEFSQYFSFNLGKFFRVRNIYSFSIFQGYFP